MPSHEPTAATASPRCEWCDGSGCAACVYAATPRPCECDAPRCEREGCQDKATPTHADVTPPEILDACCGGRMWWWNKEHPLAVYMDKSARPVGSHSTRPNWECDPEILADFRDMPFDDESFQLVLFDPPHLTRRDPERAANPTGNTLVCYGVLHAETEQDDLRRGFAECWRVLRPGGTLVFKWAGELKRVQLLFPSPPTVSTKTLRKGSGLGTRWFIFYKPLEAVA